MPTMPTNADIVTHYNIAEHEEGLWPTLFLDDVSIGVRCHGIAEAERVLAEIKADPGKWLVEMVSKLGV